LILSLRNIQVLIKTLTGNMIALNVDYSDSVGSLKQKIKDTDGIPIEQQCLIYNDEELKDEKSLSSYFLCGDGIIIRMVTPFFAAKDLRLAAGATALQGKSGQVFGDAVTFEGVEWAAVSFHVRLVADADEDMDLIGRRVDTQTRPTALSKIGREVPKDVEEL
jgi:hypothetical protein